MSKFKDIRNKNEETYHGDDFYIQYGEMYYNDDSIVEAEYQGREVKLGKPMRGDVKKFKVFVKNNKGNVSPHEEKVSVLDITAIILDHALWPVIGLVRSGN